MAQVKRIRRSVSGILILDKPRGMSSNAALQKVRWLLNAEKAGHTGSLDPLATGVLPLCFGEATKFSQYLLDAEKAYETVMGPANGWPRPGIIGVGAPWPARAGVTPSVDNAP